MEIAGAQQVLMTHARWFHQRGYPVVVVFFYDKEGLAENWDDETPFPVIDLEAWRKGDALWRNLPRMISGLKRLWRLLRQKNIQILESFTPHSNSLGVPLAWLAGVPVRVATHHGYIEGSSDLFAHWHGRLVNWGIATDLIAVSEQVRELAENKERVLPENMLLIENGIEPLTPVSGGEVDDIRSALDLPKNGHLLLTVGRLTVQKGHAYLLEAMPVVLAEHPDMVLALAGDGVLRDSLVAKAKALGIEDSVRFLGVRSDIPALLQTADVYLMPSLSEGLPMALLEAMSLAVPVVVSDLRGMTDVIVDEKHGLIVEPEDVAGLTFALNRMLGSEALRKEFGRAAQEVLFERYTVDIMCQRYEAVFLDHFSGERSK